MRFSAGTSFELESDRSFEHPETHCNDDCCKALLQLRLCGRLVHMPLKASGAARVHRL